MAADTVDVALRPDHFSGGDHLWRTGRIGDPRELGLLQMFRNLVDELDERIQSGQAAIAVGAATAAVTFANVMPDTNYDVMLTYAETPIGALAAGADAAQLFSTTKTTAGFTVNYAPAASVVAGTTLLVDWFARSRTRVHTKG